MPCRGVKAAPKDFRMYEILAEVDRAMQKPEEAGLKSLQMGVDADGPPTLWWKLGILQIVQGKFDEAKVTAKGLRSKAFPTLRSEFSATARSRCPSMPTCWKHSSASPGSLAGCDQTDWSNWRGIEGRPCLARAAFYSQGKTYEQLADFERALKAYRQAVDADPMWMPAREAVAATLQSLGRSSEALEVRRNLAKSQDASLATRVALIRESIAEISQLSADKRDWSDVDESAESARQGGPRIDGRVLAPGGTSNRPGPHRGSRETDRNGARKESR